MLIEAFLARNQNIVNKNSVVTAKETTTLGVTHRCLPWLTCYSSQMYNKVWNILANCHLGRMQIYKSSIDSEVMTTSKDSASGEETCMSMFSINGTARLPFLSPQLKLTCRSLQVSIFTEYMAMHFPCMVPMLSFSSHKVKGGIQLALTLCWYGGLYLSTSDMCMWFWDSMGREMNRETLVKNNRQERRRGGGQHNILHSLSSDF